ncbi:PaaI family thioesterase [Spirillospora sp. NPDC047279]|uniref:PaaI family thioesterase n=1 Tax=Spirillospora sp. NPDC047279 TaxID=3155478 RepID=UPI0033FFC69E
MSDTTGTADDHGHPALAGRAAASARLGDEVRRLIELCTTTVAPSDVTDRAAAELRAIADRLAAHVPDPLIPTALPADPESGDTDLAGRMPFDLVIGRHNPLAVPLEVTFEPPRALLSGRFQRAHEGPPGCVHGAVIASSFDIVLAAANVVAGLPGPTARLEITYRRPTLLGVPCTFEGEVERHEGRSVRTVGRLLQGDRVTATAVGDFVQLDRAQIARMSRPRTPPQAPPAPPRSLDRAP